MNRKLLTILKGRPTTDGDGVNIHRALTPGRFASFDPFLLLDEISSDQAADYIGGFPEHPHRGFETVTYMLAGAMQHRDHLGNQGTLVPGSVQWMTAGRGIIHSEMPQQQQGLLHGFQLWVNLPASDKLREPDYQEYSPEQIPDVTLADGNRVKIIAGNITLNGATHTGPVKGISTAPDYLDLHLAKDTPLELALDPPKTVMIYVYQGTLSLSTELNSLLQQGQLGLLSAGEYVHLRAAEPETRALLIAGIPLREPIAHWGPFVMNTSEEVEQAIQDYQNGTLTGVTP